MNLKAIEFKNKALMPYIVALSRLALSVILLILANTLAVPGWLSVVLMAVAILISAFDIIYDVISAIKRKDYFNNACYLTFVTLIVFCIGCYKEAVLFVIFYQLLKLALEYAVKRTQNSATDLIPEDNADDVELLKAIISQPEAGKNPAIAKLRPYFEQFARAALLVGVLFAVVMPLISDMTLVMSVRRGAMLISAAIPASALASLPLCSIYGISYSAAYGILVRDAEILEKTANLKTVAFDKTDVFSEGLPKLATVISPKLDNDSFLKTAAYIAINSEQRIAAPIVRAYGGNIRTELIKDFREFPGTGMEITLNGVKMYLGTKDLLDARGVMLDPEDLRKGYVLYMVIGNQYAGSLTFKENINPYAEAVIGDFAADGNVGTVLITEDGREVSEKLARSLKVDSLYCECDTRKKLNAVQELKDECADYEMLMYVSAEEIDFHTAADIDAKVGDTADNADLLMSNIGIFGLPVAYMSAKRTKQITRQNTLLVILIKLILVVLALTGSATLWFVVLLDFAAGIGGVLNVSRIPAAPLEKQIKEKLE